MTNATRLCDRCGADISALHGNARRCKTCPTRKPQGAIPDRPCEICGTVYTPKRRDSVCCSRACNGLRYNRLYAARQKAAEPERTCPGCQTTFQAWRTDQKYCTSECGNRHRARRAYQYADLSDRPCQRCGKTFTPKQSTSVFCSRLCSRRVSYARYRKERVAAAVAWARANPELRRAVSAQYKAARRTWEQLNPDSTGIAAPTAAAPKAASTWSTSSPCPAEDGTPSATSSPHARPATCPREPSSSLNGSEMKPHGRRT